MRFLLPLAFLALLSASGTILDAGSKSASLDPEEASNLEVALLREANSQLTLRLLQQQFDEAKKRSAELQQASRDLFEELCKKYGLDPEKTTISHDYKTLSMEDKK